MRDLTPTGVVLYRSFLGDGPARYEPQAHAEFSALS
jgi:hypothetical protein